MRLFLQTACPFVLPLVLASNVNAQAATPAFEVADVKPSAPGAMPRKGGFLPGGRLEIPGATLKDLITAAYGVTEAMIVGAPEWAGQQRFDVIAKAPAETGVPAIRVMMQTLLAERFGLAIHREDR